MKILEWLILPALLLGLAATPCFSIGHAAFPNTGTRVLEVLCGVAMCMLACKGSQEYRSSPLRGFLVGSLVVFAGYALTRPIWLSPESYFGKEGALCLAVGGATCVCLLLGVMCWQRLAEIVRVSVFDGAMIGALVLWVGMCLCTHGLLRLASSGAPLIDRNSVALLALSGGVALVYGITRIAYTGARGQRILLGLLGISLLGNALLPWSETL